MAIEEDRIAHSLSSQASSQIFKLLITIWVGGWTARYLGPEQLGILSYVSALVGLFAPLGGLGVKGSLSALLCAKKPLPGLLGSALLIEILGTFVISIALVPFSLAANNLVVSTLIICAVVASLFDSSEVFEVELLNCQRGSILARISFYQTILSSLLSTTALLLRAPLVIFGSFPVVLSLFKCWLLLSSLRIIQPLDLLRFASWPTIRELIARGWPLLLASLSVMLYMKSDQVMLQWLAGPKDVGQYSVAVKVAESLYFLPVILSQTYLPRIGRESDSHEADRSLRELYQLSWILGFGMSLISLTLLPLLIPLIFGSDFTPSKDALIWLAPAAFFVSLGCASGAWLNTNGYQNLIAQRSLLGALTNVCLNFFLIPKMGFLGAALATSISQFVSVFIVGLLTSGVRENFVLLLLPFSFSTHKL